MNKVVVLGAGSFGLTLANLLAENKSNEVYVYSLPSEVDSLNTTHMAPKYLGEGNKIAESVVATANLQQVIDECDYIVIALPTQVIRSVLSLAKFKSPKVFINASKGIEIYRDKEKTTTSGRTISEVIEEVVPAEFIRGNVTISGASYASEIYKKNVTLLTCASKDPEIREEVTQLMATPYLQFRMNDNQKEVELSGSLKNIVAIGSGMVGGYYPYAAENSRSIVIMDGFREMTRLIAHMTDRTEIEAARSMIQPHGLGDLMLTSYSDESRNYRFGYYLGQGYSREKAEELVVTTIEGEQTIKIVYDIMKRNNLDLPLINNIYNVIYNKKPVKEFIQETLGDMDDKKRESK